MFPQHEEICIAPGLSNKNYWRDLWTYRELFWVLAWRDVAVRYKQTALGIAWAILRPLITMFVFTLVFSNLAKLPSEGNAPYAIMVFAGMLPWTFFASSLSESAASLVTNANLISKVYFPRIIVPAATVVVAMVDLLVSFSVLVLLMLWFGVTPTWHLLFLPFFVALAFIVSLGPGLLFASLNAKYRDFRYVIPFVVQLGLYISPVGFSSQIVPAAFRDVYYLNPLVGIIDGFRWCILGDVTGFPWRSCLASVVIGGVFLMVGIKSFRKLERSFADVL
jgi:lipopolysaccharide transport system permease protein